MKSTYFKGSSKGRRRKAQTSARGGVVKSLPPAYRTGRHKEAPSATKRMRSFQEPLLHLVDIGNTSASYGLVINNKIIKSQSVSINEIPEIIQKRTKKGLKEDNIVVIASVVPKSSDYLISALNARGKFKIHEIGKDIPVPIRTLYKNASKLGIDRRIDAFGAIESKKMPCLVFDFGTALTCDLIDEKGTFLGGLIIPGPATSLKSLLKNTAQLPKAFQIKSEAGRPYGRTTEDCIQHGIIQAYAAMTDGLIAKLSKEFKKKPHVIITGGFSSFIGKIIQSKADVNPAHTLESMLKLYQLKSY